MHACCMHDMILYLCSCGRVRGSLLYQFDPILKSLVFTVYAGHTAATSPCRCVTMAAVAGRSHTAALSLTHVEQRASVVA